MASRQTSAEQIRLELARRIVTARLEPGVPLDESQLASEFGVSRTPVREALRQLASSGLVEQRPHRKAVVTKPDSGRLQGMFAVMGYLEALCAGLSAVHMTGAERRELDSLHTQMEGLVSRGDAERYTIANETFHNAIYAGTHNDYLAEISRYTRQRVQPFRRAQFGTLGRLAASHAEHSVVVEAILRGERDAAEAGMRAHIDIVEDAYYRFADRVQAPEATKALQEP